MKKPFIMALAVLSLAACKNDKETEADVETTEEIMPKDTVLVEVDTVTKAEAGLPAEEPVAMSAKKQKGEYAAFGDKIGAEKAITKEEMLKKYKTLKAGDTIDVKFKSLVKNVCQKKGCWMTLEMPDGKESFVRFKDYGFFVPLNAGDREAVVKGKAFVSEISVAELKHYAKDEGKSQADIDKITEPKVTYGFEADGVLITQ